MSNWSEIKRIPDSDGNRRVVVMSEPGGLFRFEEETLYISDDGYEYWSCTHSSGFYSSTEDAERDARIELPWMRQQTI